MEPPQDHPDAPLLLNKHQYVLPLSEVPSIPASVLNGVTHIISREPQQSSFTKLECHSNNSRIDFKIGVVPYYQKSMRLEGGMEFSGFLVKSFGFLP